MGWWATLKKLLGLSRQPPDDEAPPSWAARAAEQDSHRTARQGSQVDTPADSGQSPSSEPAPPGAAPQIEAAAVREAFAVAPDGLDERFVGVLNRYPSECVRCGGHVAAQEGFLAKPPWRVTCFTCYARLVSNRGYAVVDVETTGLSPQSSRIVEIAIIRLDADGTPLEEFDTLINPVTPVRASQIHGIRTADVKGAPTFPEILGDISRLLGGSLVVAHNGAFDANFLEAEFGRAGHPIGALPYICTIRATSQLGIDTTTRKLADCCAAVGVPYSGSHVAIEDARSTAALFAKYVERARSPGPAWMYLPVGGNPALSDCLPGIPPSGKRQSRSAQLATGSSKPSPVPGASSPALPPPTSPTDLSLGQRIQRGLPEDLRGGTFAPYFDLLDRVLEDGQITSEEASLLHGWALGAQVTAQEVADANARYVRAALEDALSDRRMTRAERATVDALAGHLGVDGKTVRRMEREVRAAKRPPSAT